MMGGFSRFFIATMVLLNASYCAEYVSIRVDEANFRAAPSLEATIKWDLQKHYPLEIISQQGEWFKVVDYVGDEGWVHEIVLSVPAKSIVVNGNDVNVRKSPSMSGEIVASAYKGEIFFIIKPLTDWTKVKSSATGKEGYIYNTLLWGK